MLLNNVTIILKTLPWYYQHCHYTTSIIMTLPKLPYNYRQWHLLRSKVENNNTNDKKTCNIVPRTLQCYFNSANTSLSITNSIMYINNIHKEMWQQGLHGSLVYWLRQLATCIVKHSYELCVIVQLSWSALWFLRIATLK